MRKVLVRLTGEGRETVAQLTPLAERITAETLAPLSEREATTLLKLLGKLA